ncbi:MAG: glycoside hydrolase family 28 protein [Phycisphaerae bacterium]
MSYHDVTEYGAVGDGKTVNTSAIQKALDEASTAGGVVLVPAGVFVSGTLHLRTNVALEVAPGATLKGSGDLADYPPTQDERYGDRHMHHFIVAHDVHDVTIRGGGIIDGNGPAFWHERKGPRTWIGARKPRVSPMFDFVRVQDLRIENITVTNSPGWTIHPHLCDRVWIRGIKLVNDMFGPNTDGIDVNGCRDVMISDCYIECGDDAIVLKTTHDSRSLERVTVTNCIIKTNCVGLKLGANESVHDMRQITFSNCVVYNSTRAVGLYNWRGCTQEDIAVSNIVCDTDCGMILNRPIHIDLRHAEFEPGVLRNVQISNFVARTDGRILMTCADGYRCENVTLRDVRLSYPIVDDPAPTAPDATSHQFSMHSPEARAARSAVVAENITNLVIDGLAIDWPSGEAPEGWSGPKTANGDDRPYPGRDENAGDPPMNVLWARGCHGGYVRAPMAEPLGGADRYDIADSTLEI